MAAVSIEQAALQCAELHNNCGVNTPFDNGITASSHEQIGTKRRERKVSDLRLMRANQLGSIGDLA
jgi:hypothetical protein